MGGRRTWSRQAVRLLLLACAPALVGWAGWTAWRQVQWRRSWDEAHSAFRAGRYATALEAARSALRARPDDPEASLLAARCLTRLGRGGEAGPDYRAAGPIALPDLREQVDALLRLGQTDRALPVLEEILRLDPRDPEATRCLAGIHHARGEYRRAEELARRLVADPAQELVGQALLGTIHHDLADRKVETHAAAIQAFERVLALDPELARCPIPPRLFWEFLARDLMAEGRPADARDHLRHALAAGSDDAGLLELLGQAHWMDGQVDEARRCWERAVELEPSRADPWLDLGQLALRQDRPADAIRLLNRARELAPDSPRPLYKLMQAHRRLGHTREVERLKDQLDALRRTGRRIPPDS